MKTHDDMRVVVRYETEDEATSAVKVLTRRGIGALVERESKADGEAGFEVLVVLGDMERACETLGVDAPESLSEDLAALSRRRFPDWVLVLIIFIAAMIILPLAAYFLSYKLSGG